MAACSRELDIKYKQNKSFRMKPPHKNSLNCWEFRRGALAVRAFGGIG
jgi:hypothetical protein